MQTPYYEYSRLIIKERIDQMCALSAPYGLTIRYAVKANPHPEIITMMHEGGINFDASSSYEATELIEQGIPGTAISLSSQQSPHNLDELFNAKVQFVATSLQQLELCTQTKNHPNTVGVRINPDMGHGHNNRTSTGGTTASFGIWHEYIPDVLKIVSEKDITINKLHVHIGSGADPSVWSDVIQRALEIVDLLPDVSTLDIGGGYKVHRYGNEQETDIEAIVAVFTTALTGYFEKTGRKIQLEIEPGTFFIAHAGTLVASIDDIVDTGKHGYTFLRLNTGMNDFLRTTLYGAQHNIEVINDATIQKEYVVVGHNCESGDIFTTKKGDPESIETRLLNEASVGDEVRIYDCGAYCASMRAKGYNAFPDAHEVFVE